MILQSIHFNLNKNLVFFLEFSHSLTYIKSTPSFVELHAPRSCYFLTGLENFVYRIRFPSDELDLVVEPSAVHMNRLTGDVAILVGNEKKGSARDLVRGSCTARGN